MSRTSLAMLSCLVLALPGCRPPPPVPPEDPQPPEPVVQEDPIEGDPADIEQAEEIGDEHMDSAKVVEPGPAETEVRTGETFERPDAS